MFLIPILAHSEPSAKETYDLMSPNEKSASRAVVYYRGTVSQAYYCMAAFPKLSEETSNSLLKFQEKFSTRYEKAFLQLMQIIQTKPDPKFALNDHLNRIHNSEKGRLGLINFPSMPEMSEICYQFAKEPQTLIELSYEYMGK